MNKEFKKQLARHREIDTYFSHYLYTPKELYYWQIKQVLELANKRTILTYQVKFYKEFVESNKIRNKDNVPWYNRIPKGIPDPGKDVIEPDTWDDYDIYNYY